MGSLLPEPFGASFLLALLLLLHITAAMAMRPRVSKPTAMPPMTMTRLTSKMGLLCSQGRMLSRGNLPLGSCFFLVRSREMCWMFVPRLFLAPIAHTSGGVLLTFLFFLLLIVGCGFCGLTTEWYWYSTLLLPMPLLVLSFDFTV